MSKKQSAQWYNERTWAVIIVFGSLSVAYGLGSRALYTGSLQQYTLTIMFLVLAINRIAHLILKVIRHVN